MYRFAFLLLTLLLANNAHANCDLQSPVKKIFDYPQFMETHSSYKGFEVRVFDSIACDRPVFKDRSGIEILKDGQRVFAETGWGFAIGYPYDDDQPPDAVKIKPGDDLSGEGQPELLITAWTGGAHCCFSFEIIRLVEPVHKLQTIPLYDADESSFVRRPGMRSLVLATVDYSDFSYFPTGAGFAGSPAGRVFLSFQVDKFKLDTRLMKANIPTDAEIAKCAQLFKPSRAWQEEANAGQPMGMWYFATDLIYTGYAAQAWRFLDAAWGGSATDKKKYLDDYRQRFRKSVYYTDLVQLQQAPVSSAGQKIDWTKQCFAYMHG
jgi:hypothetical protein